MRTHVALLGGVNLGARNRISMSDLRGVAESMGLTDVVTYIQSGNLVFTSNGAGVAELADLLENRIGEMLDVRPAVVVLTRDDLAQAVAGNPYPDETNPQCLHVVFHRGDVGPEAAASVGAAERRARAKGSEDSGVVIGRRVYLHTPNGLGRSQLAAELNRQPVPTTNANVSTMRNWATVTKLLDLLDG